MPKVFITQSSSQFDYKDAERFGELVTIAGRSVYPDEADDRVIELASRAERTFRLFEYDPRYDYVLLSGDPLVCALVSMVAVLRSADRSVRFLKWDQQERSYYSIVVNVRNIGEIEDVDTETSAIA